MKHQKWIPMMALALAPAACEDTVRQPGGEGGDGVSVSGPGTGNGACSADCGGHGEGGDGGGGHAGVSQACAACFEQVFVSGTPCNDAIQACDASPACDVWKNCAEACFAEDDSEPCYDACSAAHPHDEALSDPLFACVCGPCAAECVGICAAAP